MNKSIILLAILSILSSSCITRTNFSKNQNVFVKNQNKILFSIRLENLEGFKKEKVAKSLQKIGEQIQFTEGKGIEIKIREVDQGGSVDFYNVLGRIFSVITVSIIPSTYVSEYEVEFSYTNKEGTLNSQKYNFIKATYSGIYFVPFYLSDTDPNQGIQNVTEQFLSDLESYHNVRKDWKLDYKDLR